MREVTIRPPIEREVAITHVCGREIERRTEATNNLPVLFDQRMNRVAVRHPLDQTRIRRKGHHRVPMDSQVASGSFEIVGEESVHQTEELHHTLILTQIFVALEQEAVDTTIGTSDFQFAWVLCTTVKQSTISCGANQKSIRLADKPNADQPVWTR